MVTSEMYLSKIYCFITANKLLKSREKFESRRV